MSKISISCILPVMNETYSLRYTVKYLEQSCGGDIKEYLIVICDRTEPESVKVCKELDQEYPNKIKIHKQHLPYLGGALREAFDLVSGTHTLLMASDLETDPHAVPVMIKNIKETKNEIVVATRWKKNGGFYEYNPAKYVLNLFFQKFFSLLYQVKLTDLTYAFRIYNSHILKLFKWDELRHPFLLECIVKPLRFKFKVSEVGTSWRARTEGESANPFVRNFRYVLVGIRYRFSRKESFLRTQYQSLTK